MKRISHFFRYLFIGAFLLSFYSIAFSQPAPTLSSTTQKLIDVGTAIKAGKKYTTDEINAINEVAKARQQLLINELSNSKNVSKYMLSKEILQLLPRETTKYLESEIKPFTGKLEVRAAEFSHDQEIYQYLLFVGDETYYLHFTDGAPSRFETDAKVTIHRAMKIAGDANIHYLVLSHQDLDVVNPKYALPLSLGPQRTLTFIVNFIDKPQDRPWTPTYVNDLVYKTINNHFLESSYQQTNLVGQTAGWYVINVRSTDSCSTITDRVSSLGDQAATNDGINLANFDRKVYIFPRTSACGWAGLGVVGGSKTRSWVNGALSTMRTTAHELGHNFGIYHSRLLKCSGSPNSGSCTRSEYGDGTDIMGAATTSHFNAFQKDRLGWLNYQSSPPITTVTTSGTYTIDAYETSNQNPKALKVLKRSGSSDYYYLEFRQGIGFDAELASCGTACDYTRGVVFHQGNSNVGDSSDLLDMSPGTSDRLVALLPGQQWSDPNAPNGGVTFEVVSVQSTGAVVKVTYGTTPPPPPPPTDGKLENGVPVPNLSGNRGDEKHYYMDVPAGQSAVLFKISGGSGDADLYVRYGEKPTTSRYHCRPYTSGNNETCYFRNPPAGKFFVMVRAYEDYNGVTLVASHR